MIINKLLAEREEKRFLWRTINNLNSKKTKSDPVNAFSNKNAIVAPDDDNNEKIILYFLIYL